MGLSGIGPKWEGPSTSGQTAEAPSGRPRPAAPCHGVRGAALPCRPRRCASLQIAEELAIAVARVGKHEFPAAWPMLLAMLPSAFPEGRGVDAEHAYRALYTFNRILKVEESKVQPATCDVQHIACNPQRAYSMKRATSDVHHATASQSAASTARTITCTRAPTRAPSHAHTHAHTRALQALVRDRQKFQAVAAQQLGAVGRAWAACSAAIECALPPTSSLPVGTPRHPMHRTYLVPRARPPPSFRAASGARCDSARTTRHWADRWPHLHRDCVGGGRRPT
jgi:hypothetical protein